MGQRSSRLSAGVMFGTVLLLGVLLMASSWFAREATREQRAAEAWQNHTVEVLDTLADIRVAAISVRRGERGYLLTQDASYLRPYDDARQSLATALPRLGLQVADSPAQTRRFGTLATSLRAFGIQAEQTVALQRQGDHAAAADNARLAQSRDMTNQVLAQLDQFEATEHGFLTERRQAAAVAAERSDNFQSLLTVTGALLLILGGLASLALRNALQREETMRAELNRVATMDELTGLANRREMWSALDRMIATARRSGRPLALAVLDIDHFKQVNDTHGHLAGDEVIRRVAEMAMAMMREQDLVARLGGEEFLIAFPDCTADHALAACERLRQGIAALPILLAFGTPVRITVSSGVAELFDADERTSLIARADAALYDAKRGGRNQVRLAA